MYFIAIKNGPVKIGATLNLGARFASLQSSHPQPLEFLGALSCDNPFAEEDRLHQQLLKHRIRGEWFKRAPALRLLKTLHIDIEELPASTTKFENPNALSRRMEIRVSKEELALWRKTAKALGRPLAALIRDATNIGIEIDEKAGES